MIQPLDPRPGRRVVGLPNVPHVVYEFFDSRGEPVYVGCTSDIVNRLAAHRRERPAMWHEVVEIRTRQYRNRRTGLEVEAARIAELQPRWNAIFTDHYPARAKA